MPPTHLTGLSVHSSTPAVLSTSLSHSLFLRKTWSPCYQVLSLFYSMQRQIQLQIQLQILMHNNKYKYKVINMLNTDRQSQVSVLPSAVSCFKCMLVMLTPATNMYTNTEIHKYT